MLFLQEKTAKIGKKIGKKSIKNIIITSLSIYTIIYKLINLH